LTSAGAAVHCRNQGAIDLVSLGGPKASESAVFDLPSGGTGNVFRFRKAVHYDWALSALLTTQRHTYARRQVIVYIGGDVDQNEADAVARVMAGL
jgi:hypothetical protein